jgi:hypothetical protein
VITFICKGCGLLSDDGDIPALLCMDCADTHEIERLYDEDGGSERYFMPELIDGSNFLVKLYSTAGRLILNEIIRTETVADALAIIEALTSVTGVEYSKLEITKEEPDT